MANASSDYSVLLQGFRPATRLFDPDDGRMHIVYAGTIPDSFDHSLECFLSALKECIDQNELGDNVRVWFIGTGTWSHGSGSRRVKEAVDTLLLASHVTEHPARIGYVDALWHLKAASAVLILGSREKHYTPSKIYQAVQSANPVLALVPDRSGAAEVLRSSGGGFVVNYPDDRLVVIDGIKRALSAIIGGKRGARVKEIEDLDSCTARAGARQLADSLNLACRR